MWSHWEALIREGLIRQTFIWLLLVYSVAVSIEMKKPSAHCRWCWCLCVLEVWGSIWLEGIICSSSTCIGEPLHKSSNFEWCLMSIFTLKIDHVNTSNCLFEFLNIGRSVSYEVLSYYQIKSTLKHKHNCFGSYCKLVCSEETRWTCK